MGQDHLLRVRTPSRVGSDTVQGGFGYRQDRSGHTLATEKNKKRILPSLDVTKSDFTIGFSVADFVGKEVWLVDLLLKCGIFQRLKSEKKGA